MEREGYAGGEMVTVVDVYTRGADGNIEHYQLIPREAVGSCAGCAPGVRRFMTAPVSATAADAGRAAMGTDIGREFEAYQRSSYTEKLREQLARRAEELMAPLAPVVICMSRANGRTEMLRRSGVYRDLRSGKLVDLEAQGEAQCEELRRLHELMEPVVQSMMEQARQTELTEMELKPETLTKLVRKMEKVRILDTVRAEMEFPYLMPMPLEAPVYELDLAEVCPVCGGAKHRAEGVCGRCLLYGCARPGGCL